MPKKLPTYSWKVVFYTEDPSTGGPKRYLFGRRAADVAWRLYWSARKKGHILSVELWNGKNRVL